MVTGGLEVRTWIAMVARPDHLKRPVENDNANSHIRQERHSDVI
jgi:hypothetical protein